MYYTSTREADSLFVSALPLVKHRFPDINLDNDKDITKRVLDITAEVQDFLNSSYDYYAQRFLHINGKHRFNIKQEVVSKSIFLLAKKRYGQWIINDNGHKCDKLDIKGLDIIRSTTPPAFQVIMKRILKDILVGIDKQEIDKDISKFKKSIRDVPINDIVNVTGVKGLEKYSIKGNNEFTSLKRGAPIHVKAAIRYNDLLKYFKVANRHESIRNKDKIKWVYLKQNPLNIDAIAFTGYNDPKEIIDFIGEYIDYSKIFARGLERKVKTFYDALGWQSMVDSHTSIERFFG